MFPRECVPTYERFAGHRCRLERSGLLAACGQFELAGFDDRELLAYETFGSGCHNGRAIVM
ncbi:MAG TPA: hypothetical protein VF241_13320 [Propionibacteriaceae bacterium]